MELAEGVVLDGQYRLRLRLGRSELGEIWEAGHTRTPKLLAIKFLRTLDAPERQALFRREAAIAARLRHPSIVEVSGFSVLADGTAYLAMERLFGEDLRARLGRGALPLAEAREITRQVASALWFAHQQGIVHRELKPENIFLGREPDGTLRVKVLDFGISKPRRAREPSAPPHAPSYLAPEQVLDRQAEVDARSDVFALAAIVFEMLTGKGAFVGDTHAALRAQVLSHAPPSLDVLLPTLPRPVAVAVSVALAKDPAARHGDVRVFSDAVVGVGARARKSAPPPASEALGPPPIDAVDVLTRSERPQPASPSQPARHRLRYAAAAAVLVAGGVLASAWWQLRRPPAVSSTPLASAPTPAPQAAEASPPPVVESPPERAPAVVAETRPPGELDPGALTRAQPPLSNNSRAALAAAERALEDGASAEALRLASEALHEGAREPAYALMARAYCALRDVGMVQAMLRNLSPALRGQVRAQCVQRGLSLP